MIKWKGIILHCSASEFGTRDIINQWHKERGWSEIGYSFVICNGFIHKNVYDSDYDGLVQKGRELNKLQAHCKGYNDSIGICLIGNDKFTRSQLDSLLWLLDDLLDEHNLTWKDVYGHNEFNSNKTCPNFDVELVKEMLRLRQSLDHPDFI